MGYLQCKHGAYDCALCAKTKEPAPQAAFDQEVRDADELLRLLNLPPDCYRTDGGYINLPKVKAAVREPWDYPTIEPVNPPVAVAVGAAPLPDDVQRIVDRIRTIYAQSAASADNENYSCVFSLKDCRKTTDMLERLAHRIAELEKALPTCDKHKPRGEARATCVVCAGIKLSGALSQISYLCGPPNEIKVSEYDMHYDEQLVVEQVRKRIAERCS